MKAIKILSLAAVLTLGLASCGDSYFDVDLEQNIPTDEAYNNVKDVRNGVIGAYYALGTYRFYGRNVIALGDMASDLAVADPSSGHFVSINDYDIADTDEELTDIWSYGYKTIDRCVRTLKGAKEVLDKADELHLSDEDVEQIHQYMSECYALRALSVFTMTNIFGLPYQKGQDNSQLGIALLDEEPLEPFAYVERSTVEQCYQQVLADIQAAHDNFVDDGYLSGNTEFFFNEAAIYALEARVNLYMGNDDAALAAAQEAISLKKNGTNLTLPSNDIYVSMWNSIAITDEDIFTISKTEDDNLSANALNTLYGSYGGSPSNAVYDAFEATDIRARVLTSYANKGYKFCGTATSQAVSNVPVFRKSEMYLIAAEAAAKQNDLTTAQEYLLYTAKRNTAITSTADLPSTQEELLDFIAEERVRELYQEGHRWYDARRNGQLLSVSDGYYADYDVAKFVYPIPADEINAGFGIVQNEGWEDALPE